MDTTKPLVNLGTLPEVLDSMSESEPARICKLCAKIPGLPTVRHAENKIVTHVKEVYVFSCLPLCVMVADRTVAF